MAGINQYRPFIIATLLVIADQCTKVAVKGFSVFGLEHSGMMLGESIPVIGETLRLTFVENPGMAFGISWGDGKLLLTLLTIAIVVGIGAYLYKLSEFSWKVRGAITLVFAGAVGNLIDRVWYGVAYGQAALFHGKVVDFIQVDIPDVTWFGTTYTHFPVFNIADSCVSVGIVLFALFSGSAPTFSQVFSKQKALPDPTTPGGATEPDARTAESTH
jgi:signal peptidase II